MTTRNSTIRPIPLEIKAGVHPYTDSTALATDHWVMSQGIRMFNGVPRKIGGNVSLKYTNGQSIKGVIRSLYSTVFDAGVPRLIVGTNEHLYNINGSEIENITPFQTDDIAITNIATHYSNLPLNPLTTVANSNRITAVDPEFSLYRVGDIVTYSGATATGGVPAPLLNGPHVIREFTSNGYKFDVNDPAVSSATGGGTITRSSGLITITDNDHGQPEGNRVKIEGASLVTATGATVVNAGDNYVPGNILTSIGGTFYTAAKFNVTSVKATTVTLVNSGTTGYVPGGTLTAVGGTGTAATATITNTKVISATINAGGTGGTNGTQTVTGTTGTGTKFQALVTIAGGIITAVQSITVAGVYTVNPTLTAEPVTGAGLSGATLNLNMGVNAITLNAVGAYTNTPANPVSTTGTGTGATFSLTYGVVTVSLNDAGQYTTTPSNPVSTSDTGTGATLTVTYTGTNNIGGINSADINGEFIIRNVTTNTFDVMTDGTSTSLANSVTGNYYQEILPGPETEFTRIGYGAGLYGEGLYGAPKVSTSSRVTPRIWYFDKFGEKVLASPSDQIYIWDGTNIAAPIPLAGAPTGINYFFVSDNILVTLGAGGVGNHIFASDQGNASNFIASSENQVFEDYIEGAAPLISHAQVTGQNLLFSNNQTYTFRYIGYEAGVWQIKLLDGNVGIISPLARVTVKGTAYWMGTNNFYMYRGGQVEIIPANTQSFTTLLNYVFDNINRDQDSKCFAEYISKYNEVWFHYPTADSEEPNAIARLSLTDFSWVPDRMDRTAGEQSSNYFNVPHLANQQTVYQHEIGVNDDGQPLAWSITTNQRSGGKDSTTIVNLVPNSIQTEDINIRVVDHEWPTSPKAKYDRDFVFTTSSTHIPLEINGHFWQYTVSGDVLNQQFNMGQWYEYIQGGPPA